jgi:hypothetical protein
MPGPSVHAQQRLGTDASRARAHAAARIDGAECTRALQVRRRWRRRSAQRGATGAECGASACGLTPKEEAAAAAAAAAAATEATCARHRRHATVSSASLRSPSWGRAFGRVGAQVRCRRRLYRRHDGHGSKEAPAHSKARVVDELLDGGRRLARLRERRP